MTGSATSEAAGFNFFRYQMGQNSLRFELGELGENAWLGSRGEGHGSVDDVTGNNRAQMKSFLGWFLVHTRVGCVPVA